MSYDAWKRLARFIELRFILTFPEGFRKQFPPTFEFVEYHQVHGFNAKLSKQSSKEWDDWCNAKRED